MLGVQMGPLSLCETLTLIQQSTACLHCDVCAEGEATSPPAHSCQQPHMEASALNSGSEVIAHVPELIGAEPGLFAPFGSATNATPILPLTSLSAGFKGPTRNKAACERRR